MGQNDRKYAIFQNWLDTRPKMETHEPNVYLTILGGVSRGFWSQFLDLGAQSSIFWHLKTETFVKSTRFQVPKNGTSGAKTKKPRPLLKANIPPNSIQRVCFMHLALLGGFYGDFEIWFFYVPFPFLK